MGRKRKYTQDSDIGRKKTREYLVSKYGGRCARCGKKVIFLATVMRYRKLRFSQRKCDKLGEVEWKTKYGDTVKAQFATVGHISDRWNGGEDSLSNYQLECSYCNNRDNKLKQQVLKSHPTQSFVLGGIGYCEICSKPTKRRICKECIKKTTQLCRRILCERGWRFIARQTMKSPNDGQNYGEQAAYQIEGLDFKALLEERRLTLLLARHPIPSQQCSPLLEEQPPG